MTEVTRMRWLVFQSMPEHLVRRHSQRKIREDDFSLTSGDVCAPAQTSGVKNIVSTIFLTLPDHAGAYLCTDMVPELLLWHSPLSRSVTQVDSSVAGYGGDVLISASRQADNDTLVS